jgi:hypothetical protein
MVTVRCAYRAGVFDPHFFLLQSVLTITHVKISESCQSTSPSWRLGLDASDNQVLVCVESLCRTVLWRSLSSDSGRKKVLAVHIIQTIKKSAHVMKCIQLINSAPSKVILGRTPSYLTVHLHILFLISSIILRRWSSGWDCVAWDTGTEPTFLCILPSAQGRHILQ